MRAAVIDFETTGLPNSRPVVELQPYITQIGLVVVDENFEEVDSYQTLVNPDCDESKWSPEAIKVTGIGPKEVKDAPTFFSAFDDLASRVVGCDTWGGYNCPFDQGVLKWELIRNGFECSFPWPPKTVDVMKLAKRTMMMRGRNGIKPPKLGEAFQFVTGSKLEGAHDALVDVRATIAVWKGMA
jgi:DNA polymerase-3 subunit epsilon